MYTVAYFLIGWYLLFIAGLYIGSLFTDSVWLVFIFSIGAVIYGLNLSFRLDEKSDARTKNEYARSKENRDTQKVKNVCSRTDNTREEIPPTNSKTPSRIISTPKVTATPKVTPSQKPVAPSIPKKKINPNSKEVRYRNLIPTQDNDLQRPRFFTGDFNGSKISEIDTHRNIYTPLKDNDYNNFIESLGSEFEHVLRLCDSIPELVLLRQMIRQWNLKPKQDVLVGKHNVRVQHQLGSYRLDFLIDRNINVEVDGIRFHAIPERYKKDRMRDQVVINKKIIPIRFYADQVMYESSYCVKFIAKSAIDFKHVQPIDISLS